MTKKLHFRILKIVKDTSWWREVPRRPNEAFTIASSCSSEWTRGDSSFRGEQSKIYLMIYLSKWAKLILGEKWFPRKILIRLKQIRNQRREREYLWPIKREREQIIIKWKITKIIWEMTDKMSRAGIFCSLCNWYYQLFSLLLF